MINESKPNTNVPETYLNIGGGFNLLVGGVYKLIVGALGTGGMTNNAKAASYETWATIPTTWASETRTWLDCGSLFDNVAKIAYGAPLWSAGMLPWQNVAPWQVNTSIMTNQSKP